MTRMTFFKIVKFISKVKREGLILLCIIDSDRMFSLNNDCP